ncbi:MAG TPA: MBOAT family protein [Pirellulaceae bacterium]
MLFNSLIFLLVFLPLTLAGYWCLAAWRRGSLVWLVVASFVYYGYYYRADHREYLAVFAGSIVLNFVLGAAIGFSTRPIARKLWFVAGIVFNLGLLAYFKYSAMIVSTWLAIRGESTSVIPLVIPLAISFFTFQQLSYLVDVYQGQPPERSFAAYCLFVTFFPQLIAGPIVHHAEMLPQFRVPAWTRWSKIDLHFAVACFIVGLCKKVVVADTLAQYVSPVYAEAASGALPTFWAGWTGTLAYTCQLYFDFSGYSDMAIGLGLLFGIRLPINFNSPYQAVDIIDFWRRWHMTLSRFLRDYLYIPLGGNRHGAARRYLHLLITMLLGGLWHGADYCFAAWGLLHGMYLILNHMWNHWFPVSPGGASSIRIALGRTLTFLAVVIGWVFFRAGNESQGSAFATAAHVLQAMFRPSEFGAPDLVPLALIVAALAICFFAPNPYQRPLARPYRSTVVVTALAVLCFGVILREALSQQGYSEFLYFNF